MIGARAAAWAPCPELGVAVVIDEHDETLQEERSPTWHARDVRHRARPAGRSAAVLLTSPCPTRRRRGRRRRRGSPGCRSTTSGPDGRSSTIVDRSDEEPWRTSLLSSALIARAAHDRTAGSSACTTSPGRARILACRTCRALLRCTRCDAAVGLDDDGRLACRRCGAERPAVCQECGGSGFANLRPGVTRLREELEAAAGRPVVAVTGSRHGSRRPPPTSTSAPRRCSIGSTRADVVAFLDFDRELLAPRYRAAEQAMALLTKAARLLGPRRRGGRLMIQTFMPHHEVIQAALLADPRPAARRRTSAPRAARPAAGCGARQRDRAAAATRSSTQLRARGRDHRRRWRRRLPRHAQPTWDQLGAALIAADRPKGSRVRIAVDPPRV